MGMPVWEIGSGMIPPHTAVRITFAQLVIEQGDWEPAQTVHRSQAKAQKLPGKWAIQNLCNGFHLATIKVQNNS